jgi:hypothetical protein
MNEDVKEVLDVAASVGETTGFTRWEIVLMAVVATLFGIILKMNSDNVKTATNGTNAINNNTEAMKDLKQELRIPRQ